VTANLLKVSNSAYFGMSGKIDSVHKAIVSLGMSKVVDLVLIAASSNNLKGAQEGYDLNEGELWKNSVSSALLARELAEKKNAKEINLIFTSALLKDIGKVILNQYVNDSYKKISSLVSEQGFNFEKAEKEVIGDQRQLLFPLNDN